MRKLLTALIGLLAGLASAQPALADEIYAGIAAHQVITPVAVDSDADSMDIQIGYRGGQIDALSFIGKPSPYLLASINAGDGTSFAAAGLSWKFGNKVYLRPGVGIALHDGPELQFAPDGSQIQLGSRILFEPELSAGVRLSKKVDLEASWIHLSHGRILSRVQNPGLDTFGVRLVIRLE